MPPSGDDASRQAWPSQAYLTPFPASWKCRLKYSTQITLSVGSTGLMGTEWVARLNSLFDPDFTYTGHQPYGYDQLAAIYGQYIVRGVTVDLQFTDPTIEALVIGAAVQPSAASSTVSGKDPYVIAEQEFGAVEYVNTSGSQKAHLFRHFDLAKVEGVTPSQYSNQLSVYGAAVTANPTLSPWLRVAVSDLNGGSSGQIRCMFSLIFDAEFYRRNVLSTS